MSPDGSVVVLATIVEDYSGDSPMSFVRSEVTARNTTTGERLWTTTWDDLYVGSPAFGGLATRTNLVMPAAAGVVVTLDPDTGRVRSRCVLDEYANGERLLLAGPTSDGFFALGWGGRLCVYEGDTCDVMGCVTLQFNDEHGRIDVPAALPAGLPQDAATRAHAARLADKVFGDRYFTHVEPVPVRFDAACYLQHGAGLTLVETPAGKEEPSRVLPLPRGTSVFTASGECGGPVVALDAAGAMLLYDGVQWRSVGTFFQ